MQERGREGAEPTCALRPWEVQQDLARRGPSMARLTQPAIRHHRRICSSRTVLISLPILQHAYNPSQLSAVWKLNKRGSWFIIQVISKNIESQSPGEVAVGTTTGASSLAAHFWAAAPSSGPHRQLRPRWVVVQKLIPSVKALPKLRSIPPSMWPTVLSWTKMTFVKYDAFLLNLC